MSAWRGRLAGSADMPSDALRLGAALAREGGLEPLDQGPAGPFGAVDGVAAAYAPPGTEPSGGAAAIVVLEGGDEASRLGAWLALLGALGGSRPPSGFYLVLASGVTSPLGGEPGDPDWRDSSLPAAMADAGLRSILLIETVAASGPVQLLAESRGHLSPSRLAAASREALGGAGLDYAEDPVGAFYAAAGLAGGFAGLEPWLAAGAGAVAWRAGFPASSDDGGQAERAFLEAAAAFVAGPRAGVDDAGAGGATVGGNPSRNADPSDDRMYLRYPVPGRVLTLGSGAIILGSLLAVSAVAALLAFGAYRGRSGVPHPGEAPREALAALVLSAVALVGSRLLSALAARLLGAAPWSPEGARWTLVVLALASRAAGALSLFFAASGLAARLGLHGDHGRATVVRAALITLCVDALLMAVILPTALPFLALAALFLCLAGDSSVRAATFLAVSLVFLAPFLNPFAMDTSVVTDVLRASLPATLFLSFFAAPFGLWLSAAISPAHRVRRGRSTAILWAAAGVVAAVGEALARFLAGRA